MSTLKQMIRLRQNGAGFKTISHIVDMSKNTVKDYIKYMESQGWDPARLLALGDEELERLFLSERSQTDNQRKKVLFDLFPGYEKEMQRTGVNRFSLWNEYKAANPEGYQYTQFCISFRDYLGKQDGSMHFDQVPGDRLYMDYTGKHLSYVDRSTGEVISCEVFLAVLGYSQKTYVEATHSQKKVDFIPAVCNTFEYFGGVTRVLIPDNMKSAVSEASYYEPEVNATFQEMANHYGTTIYPTRPRSPRDKALVEKYVNIVYTRVFAALRNQTFFSIEELNDAIRRELDKHHDQLFQGKPYSRNMRFDQEEKQTLIPLPAERFEIRKFRWVTVMKNGHVQLSDDHHYYSVPYRYIGEKVKISYTTRMVTIFCKLEQIALHIRDYKLFGYTTVKEHLSSEHQFVSGWSQLFFFRWAQRLDPAVEVYIRKVLDMKTYPEQTYRSCAGILTFEKKAGKDRLIAACRKGILFDTFNYKFIDRVLRSGLEDTPPEPDQPELPFHSNIRGSENYRQHLLNNTWKKRIR